MEPEGVVHALRNVHRALTDDGVVLDLHSTPPAGDVSAGGRVLGCLDLDEFFANVVEVERRVEQAFAEGLFALDGERRFAMRERFPNGAAFVDDASEWGRTRMPPELAARARREEGAVEIVHNMLLRRYPSVR